MAEDRELLELAAKAAGKRLAALEDLPHQDSCRYWKEADVCDCGANWNPLESSGDALELAVKLKMAVYPPEAGDDGATVHAPGDGPWVTEDSTADPLAATRRAIVRAAAEIGRSMSNG